MMRIKLKHKADRIAFIRGGAMINAVPENASANVKISPDEAKKAAGKLALTVDIAEKDGLTEITARGKSAHASTPELGENALTALFALLSECGIEEAAAFSNYFPFGETDGKSCGIKCSDSESGAATAVLSTAQIKDGNIECMLDVRFPVCESCGGIISKLENTAKELNVTAVMQSEPHHVPSDSKFVKTLLKVYEDVTGEKGEPIAIGGGTYVHETENGVAFGAEFPGEENNMHGADEFITEKSLLLNAKIYANAIAEICGKATNNV